jgi:hypothetical protein
MSREATRNEPHAPFASAVRSRWTLLLFLLLAWFNWGIEDLRQGHVPDIKSHPLLVLSPPWWPLRAYVSRSGDEQLYFEDSKLLLGEEADLRYIASKRQGNLEDDVRDVEARVRPGAGLRLPYRDFPFEYPPVVLAVMVLPRLVASDLASYRLAYGVLAAVLTLLACAVGARLCDTLGERAPTRPWRRMALLVLALGPILVSRVDPLPALLVTCALLCLAEDRPLASGVFAGVAFLAKLYPLFVVAPWVALMWGERRTRDLARFLAGMALSVLVIAAPFFATAPGPFLASTFVYGARPFQIESLVGALMVLVRGKSAIVGSFGSINVVAPAWLGWLWTPLLPLSIAGCSYLAARKARLHPLPSKEDRAKRFLAWGIAGIAVVLVTSKVLSPQYMIWLLPLAVLSRGVVHFRLALAAAGLTQLFYPILYDLFAEDGSRVVALIVVARNAVLLLLAISAPWVAMLPDFFDAEGEEVDR